MGSVVFTLVKGKGESAVQGLMLLNYEVLENTRQSSLDCKEIKAVSPKGNQSSVFIGRTDAEAEAQLFKVLWPPDVKS